MACHFNGCPHNRNHLVWFMDKEDIFTEPFNQQAMTRNFYQFLSLFTLLLCVSIQSVYATHIRAGEITARRIDPQRPIYEITVTGYADTGSPVLFGSNGILDYGDGTSEQINNEGNTGWIPRTRITDGTWRYELTRTHTFPGQKTYKISFRELYRNEGVLNMDNSVNMPFYIETVIVIDAFIGVNNTPQLLVPPVDKAAVGKLYIHNAGAYDVDGDSLSYRMVFCKQDENIPVANYRFPHRTFPQGDARNGTNLEGGDPEFTLDPISGDLVWDTPGTRGEYNAAFLIEEWRKIDGEFYFLGYVTRDMQIIVEETTNEPPVLNMPQDTCIVAGTRLDAVITATDPDGDDVSIVSYGGVYNLGATYTPDHDEYQSLPARVDFSWQTRCAHIQERPYTVQFKATDARGGGVSLTDLQTWNVQVIAPAPEISSVNVVNSRTVDLNFNANDYLCGEQASNVQIWRRVNSNDFEPGTCETGMPAGTGYELVATRGVTDFPFRDTNRDAGLIPGATYCYRIVATFPQPQGGESIVSEEVCVTLPASVPLITNVSVEETSESQGEVLVRWIRPLEVDEESFPPPYTYDVYRSGGFQGGPYELVRQNMTDTSFVDNGLNTRQEVYNYYVMFKSEGQAVDSSATASTIRLDPQPLVGAVELRWQASVPWSNQVREAPWHYIYRNNIPGREEDEFVLIDSVDVTRSNGLVYLDDGRATGEAELPDTELYCYFVTTSGSYGNPLIPSPLQNNSQQICAQPNDTIPPCAPITFTLANLQNCEELIRTSDCSLNKFENRLQWTVNTEGACQDDIAYWEVYYSPDGQDGSFEVVGTTRGSSFVHDNLSSLAGFYYIVAVDRSGNSSEPSELVQNDNCPNYWLPNVFTPNGDRFNEVFGAPLGSDDPSRCPRFVQAVRFIVYNRWGKEVYNYDTQAGEGQERSIYINWDGRDSNGNELSAGTYYYVAKVTYNMLDPDRRTQDLRGWVKIVKGRNATQGEAGGQ